MRSAMVTDDAFTSLEPSRPGCSEKECSKDRAGRSVAQSCMTPVSSQHMYSFSSVSSLS